MLPSVPRIPHTLSSAAPTKAAQIRSAVTGALVRESLGLLCFEHTVETTFLLPWDLNPKVSVVIENLSESTCVYVEKHRLNDNLYINYIICR